MAEAFKIAALDVLNKLTAYDDLSGVDGWTAIDVDEPEQTIRKCRDPAGNRLSSHT